MNLNRIREQLDKTLAEHQHYKRQVKEERSALARAVALVDAVTAAQSIVQELAQQVQQKVHARISSVVSSCLHAVFEEPYEFRIIFEQKRGRTEARLVFVRDGNEVDPLTASGGGVIDVASFALRLACLVLGQPAKRKLIVMDEPFRFLSRMYPKRIHQMILNLSKELEVQFILVTHNPDLQIGKVIEL